MTRLLTAAAAFTLCLSLCAPAQAQIARSYNTQVKNLTFNNDGPEVQGIRNIKQALQHPFSGPKKKKLARSSDDTYDRNDDDGSPVRHKATRQGANRRDLAAQQDRYN